MEWNHVCGPEIQEEVQPESQPTSSGGTKGVMDEPSKAKVLGSSGDALLDGQEKVSPVSQQKADTGQVARNRRWRQKNREKYNAYMRNYRRGQRTDT